MGFRSRYAVASLISLLFQLAVSQPLAPAPAPQSVAATRCRTCPAGNLADDRSLNVSVLVETDVAQYYTYTTEGAVLVYFAARATFSHPPAQLRLDDFKVQNGYVLEILAEDPCAHFLLKGVVQQPAAWLTRTTDVRIQVDQGATTDCQGHEFPAANASSTTRNGPVGSLYVPNLSYTAVGPVTNAATNFVRLAFSEPIIGLDISQFNVSLSQVVGAANGKACVPAYQAQILPAVRNSTQFYNLFLTVPDCFYGLVRVGFTGQVANAAGVNSLPIRPVGFNRVAANIPVDGSSAFEDLPALGVNLNGSCA